MQTTQSLTIRPFIVADKYSVVNGGGGGGRDSGGRKEGRRKEGRKVGGTRWLARSLPRIGVEK